jgi:predicted transcriptional regulator
VSKRPPPIIVANYVCERCGGTGGRDRATGASLRMFREWHEVSLRRLATAVGLSPMYLCDIEKDRRNATERIVALYREWCPKAAR